MFTTSPSTVTNVSLSPASASVNQGAGQQFTATVTGTNNPGQEVVWTVDGNASASTTISSAGYLSVATNETATLLTVRATSAVDPTKSGTASVSVNIVIPTYALTVIGGVGGGLYPAFTEIDVTANPPATGKRFKNWTSSNGGTFADANSASTTLVMPGHAVTVTAIYELAVYTVICHPDGGTGAPNGSYTVESAEITLPVPSKDGSIFRGWYESADFAGSPVTAIPAGSTGNREYWAKWEAETGDASSLEVSPSLLEFAAAGGWQGVSVTSGITWTAIGSAAWITVTPASGSGNGTVVVTAAANTVAVARSATVMLTGGGIMQTITVTQESGQPDVGNAAVETADVRYAAGILSVYTPSVERIDVYAIGGALLYQAQKAAGEATFSLRHLPKGVLIVCGSSGWTRKIVNSD
ncbi:MAG: InlB B-repeat-containing protein [Tannerella sp.]|nr:InlB B-repeat-containing protein [Tannerella sp.]